MADPSIPLAVLIEAHEVLQQAASALKDVQSAELRLRAARAYGHLGYYVGQLTRVPVPVTVTEGADHG